MTIMTPDQRQKYIDLLIENLRRMNAPRVASGKATRRELETLCVEQRARYEAMSDLQIQNMIVVNF
jgi:hypothetical protein